jgi:hypothetical protein
MVIFILVGGIFIHTDDYGVNKYFSRLRDMTVLPEKEQQERGKLHAYNKR